MMSYILITVVALFIGWAIPAPLWAKPITDWISDKLANFTEKN